MARNHICEMAARGVHKTIRQAAKIPHMLMNEGGVATHEAGTYFNQLEGDLTKETYNALCADTADVVLETIYCCQRELSSVGKCLQESRRVLNPNFDDTEEKKRLIDHDFLILKIQSGPRHQHTRQTAIYIFAEKVASNSTAKAGIYINTFKEDPADIDTRYALHSIDYRSSRFRSLLNLVETLEHCSPHYSIHNNCWDYAFSTTKLLLRKCIQIANDCGGAEEECKRLHKELKHLEVNIIWNHGQNQAKRAKNFVKTRVLHVLE